MDREQEWQRLFAEGAGEYARQLACQLESGEREFSPRFESAMGEMILRESSRQPKGRTAGWTRQLRAAGLVLVCLIGLGAGAMRVEAIRIPLMDFLVGEQESYTQVSFPSLEGNATFRGEIQDYLPTWLPQGYRLESVEGDTRFIHSSYVDGSGDRIFLTATPSSGSSVMLDHQGAVVTQTEIGTRGAFISRRTQDNRIVVLMFDKDYAYTLTSYLEQGEAVAVMESIPGAG